MNRLFLFVLPLYVLFSSCEKSEQGQPAIISQQIAYIEVHHTVQDYTTTFDVIEYDAQERMVRFGNDTYTYNAKGDISTMRRGVSGSTGELSGIYLDHSYVYDEEGRLVEIQWTNEDSNMSSLYRVLREDKKLFYESNLSYPNRIERTYYHRDFRPISLMPDLNTINSQKSTYAYQQENIITTTTVVIGQSGNGAWFPGEPEEMTVTSNHSYVYDNHDNAYRQLFGKLGYIPGLFRIYLRTDDSFLYSRNNVVKVSNGQAEWSFSYKYDKQQRIEEIKTSTTTLRIHYKEDN